MNAKIVPLILACLLLSLEAASAGDSVLQLAQGGYSEEWRRRGERRDYGDDQRRRDQDERWSDDDDRYGDDRRDDYDDRRRPDRRVAACTFFEHNDYEGWSLPVSPRRPMSWIGDRYNDQVSSVRVAPGCRLRVFEHRDFDGRSHIFRSGQHDSMPRGWNDRLSSAECICD